METGLFWVVVELKMGRTRGGNDGYDDAEVKEGSAACPQISSGSTSHGAMGDHGDVLGPVFRAHQRGRIWGKGEEACHIPKATMAFTCSSQGRR
jgi:hypothetical protein